MNMYTLSMYRLSTNNVEFMGTCCKNSNRDNIAIQFTSVSIFMRQLRYCSKRSLHLLFNSGFRFKFNNKGLKDVEFLTIAKPSRRVVPYNNSVPVSKTKPVPSMI